MDNRHEFRSASAATPAAVLVVDLDGTLIRSDMLYESFWAALSRRWTCLFSALAALREGRAPLKRRLGALGPVDPALLPYNDTVLDYIRRWRAGGGRAVLVSAADQRLVERIAGHLALFDEAHGSDGAQNLKGGRKAAFLTQRYGEGGFAYVGDAAADLSVWRVAGHAVTVDAGPGLSRRVEAGTGTGSVEHLSTRSGRAAPLLRAMRPHQWLKNLLVFLPMLAAQQFDAATFGQSLLAFVAFSVIASSVYLLNDLLDLAADRAHPRKRHRPFASGALPLAWGTVLAPGLALTGFALAFALGPAFAAVMVLYYGFTTAYSFHLKRRLVVDICTLAGLYTLRIIAGAVATGIPLSVWLLAFSMFFFFALAAMKRQAELVSAARAGGRAAHGRDYRVDDLPLIANMAVSSGYISVLVMALYLNTGAVQDLYASTTPLWGICLVLLFWISRMVMITHRGWMDDDPVVFAARDRVSLICAALIFGCALAGAAGALA
ncbi:UbiA family prenyltransferase [Limimaricola pyoseonensis]|uniref:4-hydroxybenzoate polyprenyltransferase n=1 Tax=Limimaricola pyoseonensis TaxID=521013 RepID=A0A1G7J160_9RHOB|nr:UbiA family prenyltransferase [Limimaricola pyoseonensis]SDF18712.1 4-hydroxybenzoate polyprenyltransferase [Limimaricola pyoseonensis]